MTADVLEKMPSVYPAAVRAFIKNRKLFSHLAAKVIASDTTHVGGTSAVKEYSGQGW